MKREGGEGQFGGGGEGREKGRLAGESPNFVIQSRNSSLAMLAWVSVNCFLPLISTAFRIHLILTWIRIRILGSTFGKSGSGSSDPHLEKVDPSTFFSYFS